MADTRTDFRDSPMTWEAPLDWERSLASETAANARRYWQNLPDPWDEEPSVTRDRFRFDLGRLFRRMWTEFRRATR